MPRAGTSWPSAGAGVVAVFTCFGRLPRTCRSRVSAAFRRNRLGASRALTSAPVGWRDDGTPRSYLPRSRDDGGAGFRGRRGSLAPSDGGSERRTARQPRSGVPGAFGRSSDQVGDALDDEQCAEHGGSSDHEFMRASTGPGPWARLIALGCTSVRPRHTRAEPHAGHDPGSDRCRPGCAPTRRSGAPRPGAC